MKKLVRTLVTAVAVYTATSAAAQYQWAVKSGGTGLAMGMGVTSDASNNVYVGGGYSGASCIIGATTLPAATNGDGFLAKYNSSGTPQWVTRIAGSGDEDIRRVISDGTNIYVFGSFTGSITLYSTNATTWPLSSAGSSDCYVAKYNTNGVVQWAFNYGGAGAESPKDIAINTALQRLYISGNVGTSFFAASFNYSTGSGTPLWTYGNSAGAAESGGIAADASGNCYLLAAYSSPTATITLPSGSYMGDHGSLLIKLNSSGSTTWVQNIGSSNSGEERGRNVGVDAAGNVYISGNYYFTANISGISLTNANTTQLDVFVAKYNSSGTVQWARKISSSANQYINAFMVSPAGEAYAYFVNGENSTMTIGCKTHASINGNTDSKMVIVKYSPDGIIKGSLSPSIADVNGLGANSICLNGAATIVTTGQLNGSSIFGGTTLSMSGNMFVAQANIFDETPIISSNFTLCGLGSSITLTPIFPAGATIKWYNSSSVVIATTPNYTTPPVSVFSSTVYYVTSTAGGCESAKIPVTVTAYPVNQLTVTPTNSTICNGSCVTVNFGNATTATLMPGNVVKTSPFVICPTFTTNYTLTNTGGNACDVPGTFTVNVIVTSPFAGTYSAKISNQSGCTPALTGPSKPICTTPVITDPMPNSTTLSTFKCQIGNSVGWQGAGSVGINDVNFITSYTVEVYEVDNAGIRKVIGSNVAPSVFIKYGVDPSVDDFSFNDGGWGAGFDSLAPPFYSDLSADGAGNNGQGEFFKKFYLHCKRSNVSARFADYSSRVFCVDMRQVTPEGCTINKKSFFSIANNGATSNGHTARFGDTGTTEEENSGDMYNSLEIYPNPTNSVIYIPLAADDKNVQVILTDNLGKQVMKTNNLESQRGELNMENLSAGIYFYTILKNNTTYKGKIVKQ